MESFLCNLLKGLQILSATFVFTLAFLFLKLSSETRSLELSLPFLE